VAMACGDGDNSYNYTSGSLSAKLRSCEKLVELAGIWFLKEGDELGR